MAFPFQRRLPRNSRHPTAIVASIESESLVTAVTLIDTIERIYLLLQEVTYLL